MFIHNRRFGPAAILAVLFFTGSAAAGDESQFSDRIVSSVDQLMADGAPGVVVLRKDADDIVSLAKGISNLDGSIAMTTDDRFRAGSLVKSYVATVMLQLVAEGRVDLDDRIETILPGVVPNGTAISLRQLLNHTSGIFDYWQDERFFNSLLADPGQTWSPDALIGMAVSHPALAAPGEAWGYSNTNYILLGRVVETLTGRSFAIEVQERIFTPLGLDNTSFDASPAIAGSHAHGYAMLGEARPSDVTVVSPSAAWTAGGGLVSTAEDIADFYAALIGGELLSKQQMSAMLTTVPARDGLAYGLGIAAVDMPCGVAWGHQGEFPGYLSFAATSRGGSRQAVVLVNYYSLSEAGSRAFHDLTEQVFCD